MSPLTHLPLCPIWYHFESDRVPGSLTVNYNEISKRQRVVLWWTRWRSYGVVIFKVRALNMKLEFYTPTINVFCVFQPNWLFWSN